MTMGVFAAGYAASLVLVSWLLLLAARRSDAEGRRTDSPHEELVRPTWPHGDAARLHRAFALVALALAVIFAAAGAWLEPSALPFALLTSFAGALTAQRAWRGLGADTDSRA